MANQPRPIVGYGLSQQLPNIFPSPIVAKRAPTTSDTGYQLGQLWVYNSTAYLLVLVSAGSATWSLLAAAGGAGAFTTLTSTGNTALASGTGATFTVGNTTGTITIGGAAQTGAVNVGNSSGTVAVGIGNGTGANAVNIGVAGTGIVSIGNATGGVNLDGATISTSTIAATTFYASGDNGGIALTNALTDGSNLTANGAGVFTILSKSANSANSAGFIKIYIGVTAYWIPVFTNPAP